MSQKYALLITLVTFMDVWATNLQGDYYEILGLTRPTTSTQVKRAFRRLAQQYHPDKNKDPDAKAKFVKIAEAYDVLSDDEKRNRYDQVGHEYYTQQAKSSGGDGHAGPDFDFHSFFRHFDAFRTHSHGDDFGHGSFFNFHSLFDDDEEDGPFGGDVFHHDGSVREESSSTYHRSGQTCRTKTVRKGGTVFTQTICT